MASKAQGLSINTIIMVVLGLLVLVIIASILLSRSATTARTLETCQDIGGKCKALERFSPQKGCEATVDGFGVYTSNQVCLDGNEVDDTLVCCLPGVSR